MKTFPFSRLLLCVLFPALGALWGSGHAAPVDLSDEPLGTEALVPPNIMLTVDESTSMDAVFLPEDINTIRNACWDTLTTFKTYCGGLSYSSANPINPPMMAAAFNRLAYDPLVTYTPRRQADGSYFTSMGPSQWALVKTPDLPFPSYTHITSINLETDTTRYSAAEMNVLKSRYLRGATAAATLLDKYQNSDGNWYVPPHYFKTSIKWCRTTRTSGDLSGSADPGLPVFSNCQDERDSTYRYPYFYPQFGEYSGQTDNLSNPLFELVVLDFTDKTINGASTYSHPFFNEETGAMDSITRTFEEEATNYANWWAYYRRRISAAKTVASLVFSDIEDNPRTARVGYSTINGTQTMLMPTAAFTGAQRETFFTKLLNTRTNGSTPLRRALKTVGDMYKNEASVIPNNMTCMRNNSIMFTDGLWNETLGAGDQVGSVDTTFSTLPQPVSVYGQTGGSNWPRPIYDVNNTSDTLADVALYYWKTNLRPDLDPAGKKILPTNKDPATWPHMNFYGMGFGVRGTLPVSDQAMTLSKINSGALDWPVPVSSGSSTVDDLWHASVNGFGRFIAASSPDEFRAGLRSILAEILNLGGARSGVGFTHPDLTVGNQYTYSVAFEPGWSGDVIRKKISADGTESTIPGQNTAASNLAVLLTVSSSTPKPWETERKIFTRTAAEYGPTYAVPFTTAGLASTPLINALGSTAVRQANVIAYLRGDRSREGDALGKFRVRGNGPLGDIVNAKPAVVTTPSCAEGRSPGDPPKCSYDETLNPGYEQFYEDHKNRGTMVYVGANDGMLHAFDETLNEKWAYVPMDLFRPQNEGGIVNLTLQESNPTTPFHHYSYVDATPRVGDVQIKGDWRTILVGGLGKGGTSYYALDVTDVNDVGSEADAYKKSLWEFTDDNMGYTYGRAILTKTNAVAWNGANPGEEKWVAILPSGYNNGDGSGQPKSGTGRGYLFFVDLETGEKLHEIKTPDGSPDTPLSLVYIGGYVEKYTNQLVTAVYGGDQQGNLWRFNLEDPDYKEWKVEKMATLKDKNGKAQWVTTEPWPQLDGEGKRWVFFGTGGFRNNDDLTSTVDHTFYAFRDGDKTNADDFVGKTRAALTSVTGTDGVSSGDTVDTDNGWYEDMDSGYHVNVTPVAAFGKVVYAANKYVGNLSSGFLAGDLCSSAVFTGRVYARDIRSAKTSLKSGGSSKHYETFASGVADIALTKVEEGGEEGIMIAVTGLDDSGLDQAIKPKLDVKGGAGTSGVPVRTNIRYIH